MRRRLAGIGGVAGLVLVLVGYDRCAGETLHTDAPQSDSILGTVDVRCVRHPLTGTSWTLWSRAWQEPLTGAVCFLPIDPMHMLIQRDPEPSVCERHDDGDDPTGWLEHHALALPEGCDVPATGPDGWGGFHSGSPRVVADVCMVEASRGILWCVSGGEIGQDHAIVSGASYEVTRDDAPVVIARSMDDGHELWRAASPEDVPWARFHAVGDGGLALSTPEGYFEIDAAAHALVRRTPPDAQVCVTSSIVIALADGAVSASVDQPLSFAEIARPGPGWALTHCPATLNTTDPVILENQTRVDTSADDWLSREVDASEPRAGGTFWYTVDLEAHLVSARYLSYVVVPSDG